MKMVWLQWSHLKWPAILDIHAQFLDITVTSGCKCDHGHVRISQGSLVSFRRSSTYPEKPLTYVRYLLKCFRLVAAVGIN